MSIKMKYNLSGLAYAILIMASGFCAQELYKLGHWGFSLGFIIYMIICGIEFTKYNIKEEFTRSEYNKLLQP